MDDDAVSSRPHLIRVAWVSTTGWIVEPYITNTKWRMVDIHLERRHFTNQPIVIIVPICYGGLLDKDTSVKVHAAYDLAFININREKKIFFFLVYYFFVLLYLFMKSFNIHIFLIFLPLSFLFWFYSPKIYRSICLCECTYKSVYIHTRAHTRLRWHIYKHILARIHAKPNEMFSHVSTFESIDSIIFLLHGDHCHFKSNHPHIFACFSFLCLFYNLSQSVFVSCSRRWNNENCHCVYVYRKGIIDVHAYSEITKTRFFLFSLTHKRQQQQQQQKFILVIVRWSQQTTTYFMYCFLSRTRAP